MATRKTASKISKKAKLNINIDLNKPNKTQRKNVKKQMKKVKPIAVVLAIILLVGGAFGGWFGCKILTKNDCFELIGKDEITLTVGKPYPDEGVKVVSFGKDLSDKVNVETNLTKSEDGTYTSSEIGTFYMVYTVDSLKYNTIFKIQKIRLITFVEESEDRVVD